MCVAIASIPAHAPRFFNIFSCTQSSAGFEAVDRSKGRYRGDEKGGPTECGTCGLSR